MIQDDWFTIQEIDATTYAISEYGHWEKVHSFLLIGEYRAVLIDTGLGIDRMSRITSKLTSLPIDVVTTHVHTDHIGCHGEFKSIYVHAEDADWLMHGIQGLPIEQIRRDIARDITKPTPASFDPATYTPYQGDPTGLLKDQDILDIGNRILRIHHTPGHSPGHICVEDMTRGYLFTGDLLYDTAPIYAFYPSTSPTDLVASLEKMAKLPNIHAIYGSHHTLGLPIEIMDEVKRAVEDLRARDVVKFGTGIHEYEGLKVQF